MRHSRQYPCQTTLPCLKYRKQSEPTSTPQTVKETAALDYRRGGFDFFSLSSCDSLPDLTAARGIWYNSRCSDERRGNLPRFGMLDCPRGDGEEKWPKPRLGSVVRKRRKLTHERRIRRDTAVRAVSPPSVYLSRFILRTSHDASGEVLMCPALALMSGVMVASEVPSAVMSMASNEA